MADKLGMGLCARPVHARGTRRVYVEFVTDDLLTTNAAARAGAYGQYRSMGAMTANEVRSGLNLAPLPDGDSLANPYTTSGAADPAPEGDTV